MCDMTSLDFLLFEASRAGLAQVVQRLLDKDKADPKAGDQIAILAAAIRKHDECFNILKKAINNTYKGELNETVPRTSCKSRSKGLDQYNIESPHQKRTRESNRN